MVEEPTERTYAAELAKMIADIGKSIHFDAEIEKKTSPGYPDVIIYYKEEPVAVIEIKRPEIPLSDPKLNEQALRYAEWYRRNKGLGLYGVHNMRYLKLFRYVTKQEKKQTTILDYTKGPASGWAPVSDFPFKIMPWVTSIRDYKHIKNNTKAKRNLEIFLLSLKDIIEGKTLDLSGEVIDTIKTLIEMGASRGVLQLEDKYKRDKEIRALVDGWFGERGLRKPRNTNEFSEFLKLLLKEQIYTFTMKLLFYLVLQSIDADMAAKLQESIEPLESAKDPEFFRKISSTLFEYAIKKTGDFEEVFGLNTVDRLPFMPASLPNLKEIVRYLNQIKWSDISIDVIGRIFEGLIYEERRHLLGQHYTDTKIVDLILVGVFRERGKPDKLLDPSCGSGTFLVRALNYWKTMYGIEIDEPEMPIYEFVEGVDVDRLASMLAKINLYIQALDKIKRGYKYIPLIHHNDFFKIELDPDYMYITTNPPYTRQEEMSMAYFDKEYKKYLRETVSDIDSWSGRASIYAYFLVRSGKLLREHGKLGFIVENSWLNAEYGKALKTWLFNNFHVRYVIESLVERWFKDAAIITNIIIVEKIKNSNCTTRFVFLKKPLSELISEPPPASDFIANERYYERIQELYKKFDECVPSGKNNYSVCDYDDYRIVSLNKNLINYIEAKLGGLGVLRGPKKYLNIIINEYVYNNSKKIVPMANVLNIKSGISTKAIDLFYLPSKYWVLVKDYDDRIVLKSAIPRKGKNIISINKFHLRPLIRKEHLSFHTYTINEYKKLGKHDYVLWIRNIEEVDSETAEYIAWMREFIKKSEGLRTLKDKLRKDPKSWTKLPDTSGGRFLFRRIIDKNYSIYFNKLIESQIDEEIPIGYLNERYRDLEKIVFAVLNSVFTYIGMELFGRSNLGQGALKMEIADYKKIPIINPIWLNEYLIRTGKYNDFINVVDEMLKLRPDDIEVEVKRSERMKMEEFVLGSLGFSDKDIEELYRELIKLMKSRTERARTI